MEEEDEKVEARRHGRRRRERRARQHATRSHNEKVKRARAHSRATSLACPPSSLRPPSRRRRHRRPSRPLSSLYNYIYPPASAPQRCEEVSCDGAVGSAGRLA